VKPGDIAVGAAEDADAIASKLAVKTRHWISERLFIKHPKTPGTKSGNQ
jgi:hypothetical protein